MKLSIGMESLKLSLAKIITTASSFISIMLISRSFSLEEYGTYGQLLMVTNLASALLLLGIPFSINYFLPNIDSHKERNMFLSTYYTFTTVLTFVIGIVLFSLSNLIASAFNNNYIDSFSYIFLFLPWAIFMINSLESIMIINGKTINLIKFKLGNSIALIFLAMFTYLQGEIFELYLLLFLIVQALFAIFAYFFVFSLEGILKFKIDWNVLKKILIFSFPIGLASLVGIVNIEIDKLVIASYLDTTSYALYQNASKEMPITILSASFTAILLPRVSKLIKEEKLMMAVSIWKNSMILNFYLFSFFVSFVYLFSKEFFILLYSVKYEEGSSIFAIYILVLLLKFTYFGMLLNSTGQTKYILYSAVIALLTNAVLNFVFIETIGFTGPAYATLISQFVMNWIQLKYTAKVTNIKFGLLIPWKNFIKVIAFNVFIGVLFYVCKNLMFDNRRDILFNNWLFIFIVFFAWIIIYVLVFGKDIKNKWKLLK